MRKHKVTAGSHHCPGVAANRLDGNFTADAPNQKWADDIRYIWTTEGRLYLAVIVDLFSRRVVDWTFSGRMIALTPGSLSQSVSASTSSRFTAIFQALRRSGRTMLRMAIPAWSRLIWTKRSPKPSAGPNRLRASIRGDRPDNRRTLVGLQQVPILSGRKQ